MQAGRVLLDGLSLQPKENQYRDTRTRNKTKQKTRQSHH